MALLGRLRRRRPAAEDEIDPGTGLDRWYHEQNERLATVRGAVAQVTAARVRLELAIAGVEQRGGTAALAELPGLHEELEDLMTHERGLREETARLEADVLALRARGERLRAAHAASEARGRAREAAASVARELGELNLAAIRAQEAVDRSRAHADALDEVLGAPPAGADGT
jgi:phage shock protein A